MGGVCTREIGHLLQNLPLRAEFSRSPSELFHSDLSWILYPSHDSISSLLRGRRVPRKMALRTKQMAIFHCFCRDSVGSVPL